MLIWLAAVCNLVDRRTDIDSLNLDTMSESNAADLICVIEVVR
jgi:hypothetical protein